MARKKSGPSRLDLRREAEAAEAREKEKDDDELEDEDEDEDDEDEDSESTDSDDDDDADEDEKPKKKKQPAKKKSETAKKPSTRKRAVKEVRMKAVWVVFDNSSKRVGVFPFNQKKDADKLLAQKIEEKKATFYIQLVKEPMDEK